MASAGRTADPAAAERDHGFHVLRIERIITETADACSFVLAVPPELADAYVYAAGQFCSFRVSVEGQSLVRCYSMSSAPAVDAELQVTVKRVPGGVVSNWMHDHLAPGDEIEVAPPTGFFRLTGRDAPLVAFAAGSGITPVFSLVKTALATTTRPVRLLYANRDRDATIFAAALDDLAGAHPDRLAVVHHLDVDRGFLRADAVAPVLEGAPDADVHICGPGPFMDLVEEALTDLGVPVEQVHIERFTPAEDPEPPADEPTGASTTTVTIELDGRTASTEHHPGTTILQTARQLGLSPPYSCEAGSCATCMPMLVEGSATMRTNNALTPDEVDEGWVLTCQAVPVPPSVHVIYGYEEA